MSDITIGIDLGTTNSCVAYYYSEERGTKITVLENAEGKRVTPSFVFFAEKNEVVVGNYARLLGDKLPEFGVFAIKRLIGRKFDDPKVQESLKYFPFTVEKSEDNDPLVVIDRKDGKVTKSPEDICAAILRKIKKDVQDKLGEEVDKAVITVPAYFNVNQRKATVDAANKAGFTVLKLLNEPTAAALSFYFENECEDENCSVVYDLGGGTFDVSILRRKGDTIDIIGVGGDSHLGGLDFDTLIVNHVCDLLSTRYNFSPKDDRRAMKRLYKLCEEAKQILSFNETTKIELLGFHDTHKRITFDLTRAQFEKMADGLFRKTIDVIDGCLYDCNIQKDEVDHIILSGGSTRIPKIQSMVQSYFNGKRLNKSNNLDECVAEGAACQAALFSKHANQQIPDMKVRDVVPLSLGIEASSHLMNVLIKRNTTIPVSCTHTFTTLSNPLDDSTEKSVKVSIYEGERTDCRKNRRLDSVVISDLTPKPPGQCKIDVTMHIDHSGILTVTAKEKFQNNEKTLKVSYARGHRSDEEVLNSLTDAEDNRAEDEEFSEFALLKTYLVAYCEAILYNLKNKDLTSVHKDAELLCSATIISAQSFEMDDELKLRVMIVLVQSECDELVEKYNFLYMPGQPPPQEEQGASGSSGRVRWNFDIDES